MIERGLVLLTRVFMASKKLCENLPFHKYLQRRTILKPILEKIKHILLFAQKQASLFVTMLEDGQGFLNRVTISLIFVGTYEGGIKKLLLATVVQKLRGMHIRAKSVKTE